MASSYLNIVTFLLTTLFYYMALKPSLPYSSLTDITKYFFLDFVFCKFKFSCGNSVQIICQVFLIFIYLKFKKYIKSFIIENFIAC